MGTNFREVSEIHSYEIFAILIFNFATKVMTYDHTPYYFNARALLQS